MSAAADAAESIRRLNHLTIDPATVDTAALYEALGELARLTAMLPQALTQLDRGASRLLNHGRLAVDASAPGDAEWTAVTLSVHLEHAAAGLRAVCDSLSRAHQIAAHLYTPTEIPTS